MGLRIFLHAVRLVFSQLNGAVRVSGLLYLLTVIVSGVVAFYFPIDSIPGQPPQYSWQAVLASLFSGVIYLWIAIAWHRYVLLDEVADAPVPAFLGDRILAYFGRLLQLLLISLLGGAVLGLVAAGVAFVSNNNPVALTLVPLIFVTALLMISYRLAPVFPAAAIGESVGIGAAWAATSGASGALLLLAVISAVASSVLVDLPTLLFGTSLPGAIIAFVWISVTAWVKLLVGISILTAIYGVYVEKRAIA